MAWLAFPGHNTLAAVGIALLLTMLLFLGPIVQTSLTLRWAWSQGHSTLQVMLPDAEDNPMILIRNLVAVRCRATHSCGRTALTSRTHTVHPPPQAPLAEEIVFRACMTPILIGAGMGPIAIIFICPLFFGVGQFAATICLTGCCSPSLITSLSLSVSAELQPMFTMCSSLSSKATLGNNPLFLVVPD